MFADDISGWFHHYPSLEPLNALHWSSENGSPLLTGSLGHVTFQLLALSPNRKMGLETTSSQRWLSEGLNEVNIHIRAHSIPGTQ